MQFNASNIDLKHFDIVIANYDPKWIHAEAIQATEENIGKLSLEFEEELYNDARGLWFGFDAERKKVDGSPDEPVELYVSVGSWIVALRGELHVYTDAVFSNTFRVEARDEYTPPNSQDQRLTTLEKRDTFIPIGNVVEEIKTSEGYREMEAAIAAHNERTLERMGGRVELIDDAEKTQITPAVGELDEATEKEIGDRIDAQPWMQQAKAELAEKPGPNQQKVVDRKAEFDGGNERPVGE